MAQSILHLPERLLSMLLVASPFESQAPGGYNSLRDQQRSSQYQRTPKVSPILIAKFHEAEACDESVRAENTNTCRDENSEQDDRCRLLDDGE